MNGHAQNGSSPTNLDVLIIGSGISGINAAYRVQTQLPNSSFAILEGRHELGGTWSQFRYPGVRSDSDLHTLGFEFNPWKATNPIATGESIMTYLNETAVKFGIDKKIRYNQKVVGMDWKSEEQRWKVDVDVGSEARRVVYWAKWVIMGTGYYSYEKPMSARIPGIDSFKGQTIHPQFWPENQDFEGKKVVVIGSGATAITLLPALVDKGVAQITQLQRSPSYILSMPQPKPGSKPLWEKWLPQWMVLRWKRFKFILIPTLLYYFCMYFPTRAANFIRHETRKMLPDDIPMDPHFKPGYNPWEQRLCLCPDGDFFECLASERAQIVTDTIKNVVADGIELDSGNKLDADIIITATGLNLRFLGGVDLSVDGKKIDVPSEYLWRFSMLSNVPNLGLIIGYWNASWTLGSDTASRLFTRIIKQMNETGSTSVTPEISAEDKKNPQSASPLKSTYIKNTENGLPNCGNRGPWRPRDFYFVDRWRAERGDLNDGLVWGKVST
ncbi:FAD/NAD(P)-binding domain-containing protein [Dothidotthia symphoricarpi CBS 119687]|uniref:FAD/NAD(P)-binding domain-containing protein n=1 Tax=Dothidotthia symphoricarpi CBS 119687 TaxID=1392245 RepID=A0A6A6A6F0_9PLEO|nr:FAD/NAD(P)-binding domain-containing protein [Dothidotthia symphoricarpi CBS 119687]KAF2127136.1 FAD/NAD(P)-binding domain-containing protein [Dothidotthia symphoricarpi CBS 119687]